MARLMTFESAVALYEQQTEEAIVLLEELKATDCPIPGDVERQEQIARNVARMRDRCQILAEAQERGRKRRRKCSNG